LKNSLSVEHPIAGDELRAIKRYLATMIERDGDRLTTRHALAHATSV